MIHFIRFNIEWFTIPVLHNLQTTILYKNDNIYELIHYKDVILPI